jgi:hypothetical protein
VLKRLSIWAGIAILFSVSTADFAYWRLSRKRKAAGIIANKYLKDGIARS